MLNLKNTLDGYLKNVEVIGNTIQDTNNLANIRSVGDKVGGQELYKIDVVSCGKNIAGDISDAKIIENDRHLTVIDNGDGSFKVYGDGVNVSGFGLKLNVKVVPNRKYTFSFKIDGKHTPTGPTFIYRGVNTLWQSDKLITKDKTFEVPSDVNEICIGFCYKSAVDTKPVIVSDIQLEEGTQPTSYEPYQEQKLEILSPVQLEKVGDVADKIVCKDGVWGVEKNIKTDLLKGGDNEGFGINKVLDKGGYQFTWGANMGAIAHKNSEVISSTMNSYAVSNEDYSSNIWIYNGTIYVIHHPTISTNDELKLWLQANPTIVKFALNTPQFIPLPHDQQVKLRTFAGQTNIAFLTEIAGQIKAQVPKSLGATVNTHTEQIADLHNSLERVKKLEETTVSTIETESSFTTVDATNNGYFEDIKLEGNTLVNLIPNPLSNSHFAVLYGNVSDNVIRFTANGTSRNMAMKIDSLNLKPSTKYTMVVKIIENTITSSSKAFNFVSNGIGRGDAYLTMVKQQEPIEVGEVGTRVIPMITRGEGNYSTSLMGFVPTNATSGEIALKILVLEGDHTNNPPEYFEGLMSVGQDVEEVSVKSVNENLVNYMKFSKIQDADTAIMVNGELEIKRGAGTSVQGGVKYGVYLVANQKYRVQLHARGITGGHALGIALYNSADILDVSNRVFRDSSFNNEGILIKEFTVSNSGMYYLCFNLDGTDKSVWIKDVILSNTTKMYTPHQSNKKPLLYFNPTTETWEKPVLREWDTIEKHSDGKYYYHKRSKEVVLNGSENWLGLNTSSELFNRMYISLPGKAYAIDNFVSDNFMFKSDNVANISGGGFAWGNINNDTLWFTFSKTLDSKSKWIEHLQANPTTMVYQLAQEEVYECTNIDLMTYSGETNYIINSGAISPKSSLKVHNNISNVVKILQEKVSLLENTFIAGLKSVLSGDMYSLATILYPEDFEQNDNTEQDIMVIPE
jgi:hypothetical protein